MLASWTAVDGKVAAITEATPEAAITAPVGSVAITLGATAGAHVFFKSSGSGNTGWTSADVPAAGPGAGTQGSSSTVIRSVTLDAQGRVTAAATSDLGALSTGVVKVTTTTGALTTAVANTDYAHPSSTYIVQTSTNAPTNAQVLASLSTGLLKVTTTTGVLSTAAANTDYAHPSSTYIVQTATNAPTNAQVLSSLSTGLLKVTTTTGVLTTAAGGTDYIVPTGVSGGQTLSGDTAASGNLTLQGTANATPGTVIVAGPTFKVNNTANTGTDHAVVEAAVNGTAAGDPQVRLTIPSGTSWYAGVDNSASDVFNIGTGTTVGSSRYFEIVSGSNAVIRFGPDISGQTIVTAGSQPHQILNITTGGASPTFNVGTDTASTLVLRTNNTARVVVDNSGNVVIGSLGGALATNATDGFLYIPTCAGAPIGVPTARTGTVALVYDTTNNKFMIYNGAWKGGTNPGAFT